MSDPSVMAKTSIGIQGFGTALSAIGTFTDAKAEKKAAKRNAEYSEKQAADAARRGSRDAAKIGLRTAQLRGAQRASMAARGLDLSEGSPLALLDETDIFGELDRQTVEENTANEIAGFRMQGANYRARAKAINPWLSAGASALAGAGVVADRWYQYKKPGTF